MKKSILLAFTLILLSASASLALERFDIVTTEEMKQMLDDRAAGKTDFILVNSLDEIIFRSVSIPGSVNLPWYSAKELTNRLGEDKHKLIITY